MPPSWSININVFLLNDLIDSFNFDIWGILMIFLAKIITPKGFIFEIKFFSCLDKEILLMDIIIGKFSL